MSKFYPLRLCVVCVCVLFNNVLIKEFERKRSEGGDLNSIKSFQLSYYSVV